MRLVRALLVLSPLLLSGCDTIDFASLDISKITMPWDRPTTPAPTAVALRADALDIAPVPDGMQMDDLHQPFGDAPATVTASNAAP